MLNTTLLLKFSELDARKKQLAAELASVTREITGMEQAVLEELVNAGVEAIRLSNGRTVSASTQIWAKIHDREKAAEILKQLGYGDMVVESFNSNQVSAIVRELVQSGQGLPPEFEGIIEAKEVFRPKTTKG